MKQLLRAFVCLAACVLLAAEARATIYVKQAAAGGNNGTSWADAYTDLQLALAAATSGQEIWVAGGTYYPTTTANRSATFLVNATISLYGGFAGNETSINQRSSRNAASILSGDIGTPGVDSDNTYTVVRVQPAAAGAVIDGFTITKARDGTPRGGGMQVFATITVRHCIIEDNICQEAGGVQNGERASGGGPGDFPSASTYDRCIFRNNQTATSGTARSGAFQNFNVSSAPLVQNCLFYGNMCNSSDAHGGAMGIYHGPTTILNCTFYGNSSTGTGQGSYLSNGGHGIYENCILWDIGDNGGGVYVKHETGSNPQPVGDVSDSDAQGGFVPTAGQGTAVNIMNLDPKFVSAGSGDFHLQSGSPCKDAANASIAPADDLDGGKRPVGSGYDMGAYEFGSGASPAGLSLIVK